MRLSARGYVIPGAALSITLSKTDPAVDDVIIEIPRSVYKEGLLKSDLCHWRVGSFRWDVQSMMLLTLTLLLSTVVECKRAGTYILKNEVAPYESGNLEPSSVGGNFSPLRGFLDANANNDPAVGNHKVIGGYAMSKPCCVSWGPGRVDCFVRGERSNIEHWSKENDTHSYWNDLVGHVIGDIECVSRKKGYIDILVMGNRNAMWVRSYDGKWSDWTSRGGQIMEVPSCVATRSSTTVDCVARVTANNLYHITAINGIWRNYVNLGGWFQSPPAVSRRSDSIINVFGFSTGSMLRHRYWSGKWYGWESLRVSEQGRPSVVSWDEKRMDVFALGMQNQLIHLPWNGKWLPFEDLGGVLEDVPSCVNINQTIHCFVTGPRSCLYRKSYSDGEWSGWMKAYCPCIDSPSCVVSNAAAKEVSCYVVIVTRKIVEVVFKF